jgi:biopolymer transport protein ExbD
MRFSRNMKIFRGQVDAAPFAGVFFLLLLFLLLFNNQVFIPGVRVDLGGKPVAPELTSRTIKVLRSGDVQFEGSEFTFAQLQSELQERAQKGKLPARLIFDTEPGTPDKLVTQAQDLISGMGISLKTPGARLELPEAAGFPGSAASEQVIVAINSNGQIFFRNQLMNETALEQKLASVVKSSKQPVAMVLEADKMVPYGKIMKLCEIARKAQIADVTLAHRPNQIH